MGLVASRSSSFIDIHSLFNDNGINVIYTTTMMGAYMSSLNKTEMVANLNGSCSNPSYISPCGICKKVISPLDLIASIEEKGLLCYSCLKEAFTMFLIERLFFLHEIFEFTDIVRCVILSLQSVMPKEDFMLLSNFTCYSKDISNERDIYTQYLRLIYLDLSRLKMSLPTRILERFPRGIVYQWSILNTKKVHVIALVYEKGKSEVVCNEFMGGIRSDKTCKNMFEALSCVKDVINGVY